MISNKIIWSSVMGGMYFLLLECNHSLQWTFECGFVKDVSRNKHHTSASEARNTTVWFLAIGVINWRMEIRTACLKRFDNNINDALRKKMLVLIVGERPNEHVSCTFFFCIYCWTFFISCRKKQNDFDSKSCKQTLLALLSRLFIR